MKKINCEHDSYTIIGNIPEYKNDKETSFLFLKAKCDNCNKIVYEKYQYIGTQEDIE